MKDKSEIVLNIALVGVGGQGTLVSGKLLGLVAQKLNLDVKVSEVHGMSQRGGSVITYVKIAPKVFSPLIEEGEADFCLAFESLEGLRWSSLLKEGGVLLLNKQRIDPLPVRMGNQKYPVQLVEALIQNKKGKTQVTEIDAMKIALEAGTSRGVNIVMIGALAKFTRIPTQIWEEAIMEVFASKPETVPLNLQAFQFGREAV